MNPIILAYQPRYVVTDGNEVDIIEADLADFVLPEEFINIVCGALQRLGNKIETVGDMVCKLRNLTPEDTTILQQAGVRYIRVNGEGWQLPDGKSVARVWSWKEPVNGIMRTAIEVSQRWSGATDAPVPIKAPILNEPPAGDKPPVLGKQVL